MLHYHGAWEPGFPIMHRYADIFIPVCQSVISTMRNRALPRIMRA
jgi:hypothetical protein